MWINLKCRCTIRPRTVRITCPSVAHVSRQHLLHQHIRGLDANPDHARQQAQHCVWSIIRHLLETIQACLLDLADLITDQPTTTKGAFEQLGVEPVGLGASVLARYGYARCVNNVGLNAACPQPTRQPETVPASLEGDCSAFDLASCFLGFLAPSMQ